MSQVGIAEVVIVKMGAEDATQGRSCSTLAEANAVKESNVTPKKRKLSPNIVRSAK